MQQVDEKIKRAMEIYYRRNGIRYRREKEKKIGRKKWILILFIVVFAFGYKYRNYIFSEELKVQIKKILNTQLNLNNIKEFFLKEENKNTTTGDDSNFIENESTKQNEKEIDELSVIWPYVGYVTSGFGLRVSDDVRVGSDHTGIDIAGNFR